VECKKALVDCRGEERKNRKRAPSGGLMPDGRGRVRLLEKSGVL
jgi:hypothetical protein